MSDVLFELGAKGVYNGSKHLIKSDFAKNKMKGIANKYLDQALDSITSNISEKLDPLQGGAFDIHKLIGKLPRPKGGWTPGKYKYMGPYNLIDKQLEYDKNTGQITKFHVQPYNEVDRVAAQHDVDYSKCSNDKACKHKADRKMIQSLDQIPYGQMPKWGQTARFLINTKKSLVWDKVQKTCRRGRYN